MAFVDFIRLRLPSELGVPGLNWYFVGDWEDCQAAGKFSCELRGIAAGGFCGSVSLSLVQAWRKKFFAWDGEMISIG